MTDQAAAPHAPLVPSPSQTVGPFFHFCLTADTTHGRLFPDRASRMRLAIRVTDGAGAAVTDAAVEIWQACDEPGGDSAFGRLPTDADGTCEFDTVRPCAPPDGGAPHINICLFARGLLRQVYTRLYFAGDAPLADDPVLALVPAGRRDTLIARLDPADARRWLFHVRLQGADETVFFDV
jgi:protocatechuate 3,4-dioxygenase alpha subunit